MQVATSFRLQVRGYFYILVVKESLDKLKGSEIMKKIKTIVIVAIVLAIVYTMTMFYLDRIEKIENGEMTLVSETYRD